MIDLRSVFEGAQAYVMLSRIKELEQLYILEELPENKIYPIQKALEEIIRLQEVSINNNPNLWDKALNPNVMKVSYLNTRSLVNKFENIKSDKSLQQSDILVLAETWIPKNTDTKDKFKLENYETHLNSSGRGKGLAIFQKQGYGQIRDHNEENINITMIELGDLDIIAVYRSTDGNVGNLIHKLEDIINISKSTMVIGDMNLCNKKMPTNELRKFLEEEKIQAGHT